MRSGKILYDVMGKGYTVNKYGYKSMELDGGTDLDRLHAVFSMDDPERGAGRTFLDCNTVAGVLETTGADGIICRVPKYNRVIHIMEMMVFKVFPDHGISFHQIVNENEFIFFLPGEIEKRVRFIAVQTLDNLIEVARGWQWPMIEFTECDGERGADNWKNRVPLM